MNNSDLWKEIRRLKKQLKRKRSRSASDTSGSRSESPPPRLNASPPREISPPQKRLRRRVVSSESSDISNNSQDSETNQVADQDDIFSILGEDPTVDKEFSEDIHSHMAVRWNNVLQKGIKKENRSDLIKKYLPPANCAYLKTPKLNDEIKAAVQESSVKRDSKLELKQTQLGAGITCIGRALDAALKISDKELRDEIIKHLGDGGQILTDLHFLDSITRRSLLAQGLNKNTKDAIKDIPRDHLLFGDGLPEKLKAVKACSKSAADIKTKPPKASSNRLRSDRRGGNTSSAGSLNWRGSSRRAATVNTYNNMTAGAYRERRPAPAQPAPPRRAQTSQRPPQARRT